MDGERWERVKELFEAARERDQPERSPFLEQACAHDPELRREVESLLSGDENAGNFLQEPVAHVSPAFANDRPPPVFSPSEIVSRRYLILRFMGRGGMGEVYEARDLERKVRVALKTIRPEIASDPNTLARFNKEIDLALRVTHHNVCRVYHLERHRPPVGSGKPEVVFLTMELLEGETLADRLRRQGRMSCEEALPLIGQMAEGLAAAHKEHVVHCDFKPGNVMLVSERPADVDSVQPTQSVSVHCIRRAQSSSSGDDARGGSVAATDTLPPVNAATPASNALARAVITDFGLARAMRPTVTHEAIQESVDTGNHLVGTLPYMAPEQLEGHPATTASDVYAFGLVIYEMVTGRQPFSGDTPLSAIYKRLQGAPPPPRTVVRGLDSGLESVIMRCLEREPVARYVNADEVVVALGGFANKPGIGWRGIRGTVVRSGAVATGVLLLAAVLVAAVSPRMRELARSYLFAAPIPARKNLVVLPFKAVEASQEEQARCDGFTETVTAKLAQSASLQVPPARQVLDKNVDSLSRARSQFGANMVLLASLQQAAGSARVNLNLVDTKTGQTLRSDTVTGRTDNLFALQDDVVFRVFRMLRIQPSDADVAGVSSHGTSVLTAYDFYIQGLGYMQHYERVENLNSAIALFHRSIAEDPRYAEAQAQVARAYWFKYKATQDPEWANEARAALKAAQDLNSQLPEVQLAIGNQYQRTGAHQEAVDAFLRAVALDPENVEALEGLGNAYFSLGQASEAEQTFRHAIEVKPACWSCFNYLGLFLMDHRRYSEAAQAFERVAELAPDNVWADINLGRVYFDLGEFERAAESFRRGLKADPNNADLYMDAGTVSFYVRRYEEAARLTEKAVELEPSDFMNRGNLADDYRAIPAKSAEAAPSYRRAIELAQKHLEVNPRDSEILSYTAIYYARLGERAAAHDYLDKALKEGAQNDNTGSPSQQAAQLFANACLVYLEAGEYQESLKWLQRAVQAGYPRGQLLSDPEFDSLRPQPAFQRLVLEAKSYQ